MYKIQMAIWSDCFNVCSFNQNYRHVSSPIYTVYICIVSGWDTFLFIHLPVLLFTFATSQLRWRFALFCMSMCHQETLVAVIKASLSLQLNLILSSKLFFLHTPNPPATHWHTERERGTDCLFCGCVLHLTIGQRWRLLLIFCRY